MGSAAKSVSKGISKVGKAVSSGVSKLGKTASNVSGTVASKALDVATLGQKDLVNNVTGGGVDALEGAYRGNTTDIARLAATGGAFAAGGPMAAIAANQQLAAGGNPLQVALTQGTGMSWLDDVNKVLQNPTVASLTSNLFGSNSAPKSSGSTPQQIIAAPPQASGLSSNMLLIGGAVVLFLVGGLFLIFRGRK